MSRSTLRKPVPLGRAMWVTLQGVAIYLAVILIGFLIAWPTGNKLFVFLAMLVGLPAMFAFLGHKLWNLYLYR